jgi:hypothetical protein
MSAAERAAASVVAAQHLAAEGKAVFPCREDKAPTTPRGFLDAVTDPDAVHGLWCLHPGPLVGVATGAESGFDVLDLDVKHPEAESWWLENRPRIPGTRAHRTRSGGWHFLFAHAAGLRNSASKIARGVDVRGDGGYIIWWPAAGWPVLSDAVSAPWPAWLLALARPRPEPRPVPSAMSSTVLDNRKLAGLVKLVALAGEGERNRALFWAACRVAEAVICGTLSESFATAALERAAIHAGLPAIEARRTISSAKRSAS